MGHGIGGEGSTELRVKKGKMEALELGREGISDSTFLRKISGRSAAVAFNFGEAQHRIISGKLAETRNLVSHHVFQPFTTERPVRGDGIGDSTFPRNIKGRPEIVPYNFGVAQQPMSPGILAETRNLVSHRFFQPVATGR
nr:hypothetical protein Iba_chr15eCG0840 [Ipomoea batatas]